MRVNNFKLSTGNVRTTFTGLSDNLNLVTEARKTALIMGELRMLYIDVAIYRKTRIPLYRCMKATDNTIFWERLKCDELQLRGFGFTVRRSLMSSFEPQFTVRIMRMCLKSYPERINILSIHSHRLCSTDNAEDVF